MASARVAQPGISRCATTVASEIGLDGPAGPEIEDPPEVMGAHAMAQVGHGPRCSQQIPPSERLRFLAPIAESSAALCLLREGIAAVCIPLFGER
jgi:hypothetical protein